MNTKVFVLDKGFVRLHAFMQPVPEKIQELTVDPNPGLLQNRLARPEGWTGDLEVVRNARVSYDADWRTGEDENSDSKLIRSMTNRNHTSPFEAMVFTFEIYAPIFVFRQWHRHRTQSYNELSARYAKMNEDFYLPDEGEIGGQHATDKQMRSVEQIAGAAQAQDLMSSVFRICGDAYNKLLSLGVARELARIVMPFSVYSRMFCTIDLHNLRHFLNLRQDEHAQKEIRVYADAIHELVTQICPVSMAAFDAKRAAELELRRIAMEAINKYDAGNVGYSWKSIVDRFRDVLVALGIKK